MEAERRKILEMLQQGQLTVEQAEGLLEALEQSREAESPTPPEPEVRPAPRTVDWRDFKTDLKVTLAQQIKGNIAQALKDIPGMRGIQASAGANFNTATFTRVFLERLSDGASYTNFGVLRVAEDIPEDLLRAKIADFTNFGTVHGPRRLLQILQDRCSSNLGGFAEDAESGEPTPAPSPAAAASPRKDETAITGWELAGGWRDWPFHGQYQELVVECQAGHLQFEGVESGSLELAVRKPPRFARRPTEDWAGGLHIVARQEGDRLVFELGDPENRRETEGVTFRFGVPPGVSVTADTGGGTMARAFGGREGEFVHRRRRCGVLGYRRRSPDQ